MEQDEINDKKLKELQEWLKKEAESGRPWIFLLLLAIFMPKDVFKNSEGGETNDGTKPKSS